MTINLRHGTVINSIRALSPRHRRWQRILASLTFDPTAEAQIEAPSARDFIICGCPRTGTALATAMLFRPPSVITVMEPWDAMRMSPASLFASLRSEIRAGTLRRGRLDLQRLEDHGDVAWCRDGERPHKIEANADFLLGVKFPSFWRYLEVLPSTKFVVCVRHPVEVVRSFRRKGGQLAKGLEYDIAFNRTMNERLFAASSDQLERCVLMYDYVCSRLLPYLDRPNVYVLRYERWADEAAQVLAELAGFLEVELGAPNAVIKRASLGDSHRELEDDEARLHELIHRSCTSATALGYEV